MEQIKQPEQQQQQQEPPQQTEQHQSQQPIQQQEADKPKVQIVEEKKTQPEIKSAINEELIQLINQRVSPLEEKLTKLESQNSAKDGLILQLQQKVDDLSKELQAVKDQQQQKKPKPLQDKPQQVQQVEEKKQQQPTQHQQVRPQTAVVKQHKPQQAPNEQQVHQQNQPKLVKPQIQHQQKPKQVKQDDQDKQMALSQSMVIKPTQAVQQQNQNQKQDQKKKPKDVDNALIKNNGKGPQKPNPKPLGKDNKKNNKKGGKDNEKQENVQKVENNLLQEQELKQGQTPSQQINTNKPPIDLNKVVKFEIKSLAKVLKLSSTQIQYIPVQVEIQTGSLEEEQKPKPNNQQAKEVQEVPVNVPQNQQESQDKVPKQQQELQSEEKKAQEKVVEEKKAEEKKEPAKINSEKNQQNDKEVELKNRPAIDLVCVIDRSGSMQGEKLQLVKNTLFQLLEMLNEKDRICLIQFDDRADLICSFQCVGTQNIQTIKQSIKKIQSTGGTNIPNGIRLALSQLKKRKSTNDVTSVFLLSDGQDGGGGFTQVDKVLKENPIFTPYTIHSFGFGSDHDPILMNQISKAKDGNFYYVEKLSSVDEMFVDALGALFSVIAQNISIGVWVNKQNQKFSDVQISKTYGEFWKIVNNNVEFKIDIVQLICDTKKQFILELAIPPLNIKIDDHERNNVFLKAQFKAHPVTNLGEEVVINAGLEMTIYNENEEIPPAINDEDVEVNYLRVQAADAMQQIIQKADMGNYEEGVQILENMQKKIKSNKPQTQQKLQMIINDLDQQKELINPQKYSRGKKVLISQQRAHMEQRSYKVDFQENEEDNDQVIQYQNKIQKCMVKKQKCKKMQSED